MSSPSPEPHPHPDLGATGPGVNGTVSLADETCGTVVHLRGEIDDELRLDLDDAAAEVAERHRSDPRPVQVDAREVTFMDSTGASFLARLAVAARPDRVTIRPSEPVAFLLEVTRLADVLDIADHEADRDADGDALRDAD